jgi:hypothetical protein
MPRVLAIALLMVLVWPASVVAQSGPPLVSTTIDQHARFPSLEQQLPALQSTSGRFSSINPPNQVTCRNSSVVGRVISNNLIHVDQFDCLEFRTDNGYHGCCSLVNVELADPADASKKMIPGRRVIVKGTFKSALEDHSGYPVNFVFVEAAQVTLFGTDQDPLYANATYIVCQPPQLAALSRQVGHDLCVQSDIIKSLDVIGPALETAARSLDNSSSGPDAIMCRIDPAHTDAGLLSEETCAFNNYWDWWVLKEHSPLQTFPYRPPKLPAPLSEANH